MRTLSISSSARIRVRCLSIIAMSGITQKRTRPYDIDHDRSLISTAHSKRISVIQRKLAKLDALHPKSYGISIIKPEFGYWKVALSGLLKGFECTEAYRQLLTDLENYVNRDRLVVRKLLPENRHQPSLPTSVSLIYDGLKSKTSRDSIRKFLQLTSKKLDYNLSIQLSTANILQLKQELQAMCNDQSITGRFGSNDSNGNVECCVFAGIQCLWQGYSSHSPYIGCQCNHQKLLGVTRSPSRGSRQHTTNTRSKRTTTRSYRTVPGSSTSAFASSKR